MKHFIRWGCVWILFGMSLVWMARGQETVVALQTELTQVNATLAELSARTPDSPEAVARREAARTAWKTYQAARAAQAGIQALEMQVAALVIEVGQLRADQETTAAADTGLQSLRSACETAIEACRSGTDEERVGLLEQARKARDAYATARASHEGIRALEVQVAAKQARIAELRAQEETVARGDADLQTLKARWLAALTACREYLPDRATLAEMVRTRTELQKRISTLQEVSK